MFDYGEACPISKATTILGERWTLQILREMMLGVTRFSEFQRYLPRISPSLLNTRLKSLEQHGIIIRKTVAGQKSAEYLLTPAGKSLRPLLIELGKWGMEWAFDSLLEEELHALSILRDIAVHLNADLLPAGDCIMQFTIRDLEDNPVLYLFMSKDRTQVCDEKPGLDVDIYINTDQRTLTELWYGKTSVRAAQQRDKLQVLGNTAYTKSISKWFPVSRFAAASASEQGQRDKPEGPPVVAH